ncbi:MAG TPA: DinB family protein [Taishania sp.]|nr:DinB family protein [Taishania sp.]
MMQAFFKSKFLFDFQANQVWIETIDKQNLTSDPAIRKLMCHILNVHHVWVSRLNGREAISGDWDDLPYYAWQQLNEENYRQTNEFVEHQPVDKLIHYTTSEGVDSSMRADDILYHILQHNIHHRAQINSLIRKVGATPAVFNFIEWKSSM